MKTHTTSAVLILLALLCLPLGNVQSVNPPPDGCYPGLTTAEGCNALASLTGGIANTAVGWFSQHAVMDGSYNTAVGAGALDLNNANENTAVGTGALLLNTTGANNTAVGAFALINNTDGNGSTAIGDRALQNNTADGNTATGFNALLSNTAGVGNTATGLRALESNTTGIRNTAVGVFALNHNIDTGGNTAVGYQALVNNTANSNTAVGNDSLVFNTTGGTFAGIPGTLDEVGPNTAVGALALGQNTTAGANTAVGYQALGNMTIGNAGLNNGGFSTAVGFKALASADTSTGEGFFNDAFGYEALAKTTTGLDNVGIGFGALFNNTTGSNNAALGYAALFQNTGDFNTALGFLAGYNATSGGGNVYIGASIVGSPGESNHTYIRNIKDTTVSGGGTDTVTVDLSTGLLGHLSSSRRYKEDIQPMDNASETLFALKPVTYRYKKEIDQSQSLDYGLIAEEVAQVDPNLAIRDGKGQIESFRYTAINAMVLNEFLKEHRMVQEQGAMIAELQKEIGVLKAGLQRVSAQVEISRPRPQMAGNKTD
jgi:hypothetical protein